MNDNLLRVDIELDVKTLEKNWLSIKEQEGFINLTPFTYNIEILGAEIEDTKYNNVPLRLGDIIKLQRKIREIIPTVFKVETIFYKLKRLSTTDCGLLFGFDILGQHYVYFLEDLDKMFEELFMEIGYKDMKKNNLFIGDYLCPSAASLSDYLTSVRYNKSLELIVCEKYIGIDGVPFEPEIPHIIPSYPSGTYQIDVCEKIDWKKLKYQFQSDKIFDIN